MKTRTNGGWVLGLVAAGAAASGAAGQDVPADEIQRLKQQLEQTNALLKDVKGELDELKAQTNENWMTEARAEEIRGLVADVLADADTRASLLQGGMTAGWNDGFFLSDYDGRFLLEINGQMQVRFMYNFVDRPQLDRQRWGFENTRTRLTFRGYVFNPDLEYYIRGAFGRTGGDAGGTFGLQDAWIQYALNNDNFFRFGQFKLPFTREELVSSAYQLVLERSLVNESQNLGWTQGLQYEYRGEDWAFYAVTSDGATDNLGGFGLISPGGDPQNTPALEADTEFSATTRAEYKLAGTWNQFRDFTSPPGEPFALLFGAAAHYQTGEHGSPTFGPNEEDWWAFTADISAEWGGANAFLAFVYDHVDGPQFDTDVYGAVLQGGYYLTPKIEVYARYEWGQFQVTLEDTAFESLNFITVGTNYYFDGHDAKFTADVGYGITETQAPFDADIAGVRADEDEDGQFVFRTQFQLLF